MSSDEHEQLTLQQAEQRIQQEASLNRIHRIASDTVAKKHLRVRFDCRPDAMPPELHQIIARWLYTIARAGGADRERRTLEAVRTIGMMTDWHEWDIQRAMKIVAENLSPGEANNAAPTGSASDTAGPQRAGTG